MIYFTISFALLGLYAAYELHRLERRYARLHRLMTRESLRAGKAEAKLAMEQYARSQRTTQGNLTRAAKRRALRDQVTQELTKVGRAA